jgi:uncharacterized damage-inducible protein DinB
MLGPAIFNNQFEQFTGSGKAPDPPESWDEILSTLEKAHAEYVELIRSTPPGEFETKVKFLTGPRQVGEMTRTEWLEFMLGDEIHHRGQFSVYLRMAGGKVPSI